MAPDYFRSFFRNLAASRDDSMLLARADGSILIRSPAVTGSSLQRAMYQQNSRDVLARIERGTTSFVSPFDGVERIAAYRKLADYPVYVGYGLSTAAVLRTSRSPASSRWRSP